LWLQTAITGRHIPATSTLPARQDGLQGFGFHTAIGIEELLTKGEEGDGTIHGSAIYIDVTYLLG